MTKILNHLEKIAGKEISKNLYNNIKSLILKSLLACKVISIFGQ